MTLFQQCKAICKQAAPRFAEHDELFRSMMNEALASKNDAKIRKANELCDLFAEIAID